MAPNYGIGLLCQKKDKMVDVSPRRRAFPGQPTPPPPPTSMGADFYGEGKGHRFGLANRFGARFGTNTKLSHGVIRPISTPNDYLNKVFDDVVSLCGSCRNNALPRSAREKLQLVAILSLRETRLSLQERNMRIV